MKTLVNTFYNLELKLIENEITVLSLEAPSAYQKIMHDLWQQYNGSEGSFILSIIDRLMNLFNIDLSKFNISKTSSFFSSEQKNCFDILVIEDKEVKGFCGMKPIESQFKSKLETISFSIFIEGGRRFNKAFNVKDLPLPLSPINAVEFLIEKDIFTNCLLSKISFNFLIFMNNTIYLYISGSSISCGISKFINFKTVGAILFKLPVLTSFTPFA